MVDSHRVSFTPLPGFHEIPILGDPTKREREWVKLSSAGSAGISDTPDRDPDFSLLNELADSLVENGAVWFGVITTPAHGGSTFATLCISVVELEIPNIDNESESKVQQAGVAALEESLRSSKTQFSYSRDFLNSGPSISVHKVHELHLEEQEGLTCRSFSKQILTLSPDGMNLVIFDMSSAFADAWNDFDHILSNFANTLTFGSDSGATPDGVSTPQREPSEVARSANYNG
ncbi:hypothetical protein G4H71_15250 [Rhodococcus triatomae]|uniref:hypothetical protein n=1 Tax=Rhodococcus triatomae TaxID=300028 RepID=UPI001114398A|nr:hypothetical protein [Rhodococcus triatomae]QNG19877.1 hypothetical protein G4H72_15120 [Rhodococcus triatomae]QNG24207.1 hypothetical protein G4H71_15250 [Rhodococcus triatomae]